MAGVDPGTGSMDIIAVDDENLRPIFEASVPRPRVTRDPSVILKILDDLVGRGIESIAAPSGYGMPLRRVQEASVEDIMEATFINCMDEERGLQIVGLRRLMLLLRESQLPAWFTPGAVHLPTIPEYRKANRIDMGTADKIYTVVASMAKERLGFAREPGDMNILVVEAGMAYTSVILVETGQITDAIAGTAGFWGFMGGGFMDSEVAYALASAMPGYSKALLFQGGASTIYKIRTPEELEALLWAGDARGRGAARMLAEGLVKSVAALLAWPDTRVERVYISGRLFRRPLLADAMLTPLRRLLEKYGAPPIVRPLSLGRLTKEAATGAAILASAVGGGRFGWIADSLRLREAEGSIFSWVTLADPSRLREYFVGPCISSYEDR